MTDNILIGQFKIFNDKMNNNIIDYIVNNNIMVYYQIDNIDLLVNSHAYGINEIEFKYDENNFRIPYFENQRIICLQVDPFQIYNYISSTSLLPYKELIFGERIQQVAEIVIGNPSSISFNPNNIYYSKALISIDRLNDLSPYNKIFVFPHDLLSFYNKFNHQIKNKIIITHNSDHEITFINDDIQMQFSQNCLIKHPKLIPLPIGIENNQWFDHKIFDKVRSKNILKTKEIYFFFNLNTHPSRYYCYNLLKDKLEWNTKKNKEEYFMELASHKYAICPRGNGLDTHRIWECLYLNVIPIIIEPDDLKISNLPMIVFKDWSEFDPNQLKANFKNQELNKITFSYYNHLISNF